MDLAAGAIVIAFAIRGLLRGTTAQVFSLLGVVVGLWAATWVSQWVGLHWDGARPAVVFAVLRWLVAGLCGLAAATLFQWWGELLAGAVRESPLGWLDSFGGLVLGSVLGSMLVTVLLLVALLAPWPRGLAAGAAGSRAAAPLMGAGASVCDLGGRFFPGSHWLKHRFLSARTRARS